MDSLQVKPQVVQFELQEDAVPTIAITKLKNNQVVLSTEVLTFEIQSADDFGVKQVGLEWEGIENPIQNPEPAIGEKVISSGTPESESLIVPATFSVEREMCRHRVYVCALLQKIISRTANVSTHHRLYCMCFPQQNTSSG